MTGWSTASSFCRVQPAEHEVGVGDGRLCAAAAIADRPGIGAGALRPDRDQPGSIDTRDRAAAGADRMHGDHRHMDRHRIFDLDFVGDCRLGVEDQRDIGRGAAHVVGDERRKAGAPPGIGGGDHARRRAGHHGLGGLPRHVARRDHAAIAVHDQEIARIAARIQFAAQARDIAFEDRLDAGIDRRRDAALELARFRQQRVAGGDVAVRPDIRRRSRRPAAHAPGWHRHAGNG